MAKEKHFDLVAATYGARARKGLWGWLKAKEMFAVREEVKSAVANLKHTPKVLDVGCGVGLYSEMLGREISPLEIVGIDKSPAMLQEFLKRGFKGYSLDIEKEPFPQETFDIILLLGVLEFTRDVAMVQLSLKRSLAPNGEVLVLVPAVNLLNVFYYFYHRWHGSRICLRTDKLYRKLFHNSGLEITKDFKVTPVSRLLVLKRNSGNMKS